MSYRTESLTLPIQSLTKGYDSYHGPLELPEGAFPDGENVDLRTTNIHTIDGLVNLFTSDPPDGGKPTWADAYHITDRKGQNPSQPDQNVPSQNGVVVATDQGNVYFYDLTNNTYTLLRSGLSTTPRYWTNARFRDIMLITNGVDVPMQYDGSALYPITMEPVARFESADGWTSTGTITNETTLVREGTTAKRVTAPSAGTWITTLDLSAAPIDLATGIGGALDFTDADFFRLQVYVDNVTKLIGTTIELSNTGTPIGAGGLYSGDGVTAPYEVAQKITTSGAFSVSDVQFLLRRTGTLPGTGTGLNLRVLIMTDSTGPSNTVITDGTSDPVIMNDIPPVDTAVTFTFSTPPALSASTSYWLVLREDVPVVDTQNSIVYNWTALNTNEFDFNTLATPLIWAGGTAVTLWFTVGRVSSGSLELRLYSTEIPAPAYFTQSIDVSTLVNGWNTIEFVRSGFSQINTPSWSTITKLSLTLTTNAATFVVFDDMLLAYNNSLKPSQLVAVYNGSALFGDQFDDRIAIQFSEVGQINNILPEDFIRVTGGTQSLEEVDRVSALKVYAGIVIVGKPNSIFSLTGAPGIFTLSPFSTEIGIDSHRGVIESPRGVFFPHDNAILALRLTSKDILSTTVSPTMGNLDVEFSDMTIGLRHDETHTLRWSFRQIGDTGSNSLQLWYDYYANCWLPPVTAYPVNTMFLVQKSKRRKVGVIGTTKRVQIADTADALGGTTVLGNPMVSRIQLPYRARTPQKPNDQPLSTRWVGFTAYVRGIQNAEYQPIIVGIYIRTANHPAELVTKPFINIGNLQTVDPLEATETFIDFPSGVVARYIQVELRSAYGQFELLTPCAVHYVPTDRPGL